MVDRVAVSQLTNVSNCRVVDMVAFNRLRGDPDKQGAFVGATKIAKALGVPVVTAQRLMGGIHWQQDPERVKEFNASRGASVDPETGIPTAEDLEKFGGRILQANRHKEAGEKDAFALMRMVGAPEKSIAEAVRRIEALAGYEVDIPAKIDSDYFKGLIDEKLARALLLLDDTAMAQASPKDLITIANGLFNMRQVSRGEPTAIVKHQDRGTLEKLGGMVLREMQRRGVKVDDMPAVGQASN